MKEDEIAQGFTETQREIEQLRLHDISNRRELLIKFCDALFEQNGTQITNVQIDFLMKNFNL